ncbi:MAG: bifunctional glutamate N-acetyltransferase/amino-acid acetyltransferase ArgJ [Actinobacteria bacterium]|nr:bifunctional glutamate N-acetyltransferase/amino-acid acetyltransferase ArgJ [Actinomycetota bacterium]
MSNKGITAPKGFKANGIACGIKESGKKDLAIIFSEKPASAAAVFTTSKVQAAPVLVSKEYIEDGIIQAIIINSGNANACTGAKGLKNSILMTETTADELKINPRSVLIASTGIIGVQLPMDKIKQGVKDIVKTLSEQDQNSSKNAAEAIMTTDTFSKELSVELNLDGVLVSIGGMAKGSGMIAPNMATMLCFITTDVNIEKTVLENSLKKAVDLSFNMITVDGEISTNDMTAILANGLAGNKEITANSKEELLFQEALNFLCVELAKTIVKDGEGATKFIEISVENAKSFTDAKNIALSVANSNLVKTAFFGEDANWGRIMAAIGKAEADINSDLVDIYFEDQQIVKDGTGFLFDEEKINQILKSKEIKVKIDLKNGRDKAKVWTSDLSYDYVKINADYRT